MSKSLLTLTIPTFPLHKKKEEEEESEREKLTVDFNPKMFSSSFFLELYSHPK